ncbi:hypothetical protein PoB_001704800 [Plakobranchus ocellatus]|uniref:Uncharacterized protein n=1 Tax=Plakobranchus ocellatus TaxID=259542 RepID=A0AAV3Z759_9GAST|nr:hypothetical protein PoB_001704800 [Plakobranchus ocellatus]
MARMVGALVTVAVKSPLCFSDQGLTYIKPTHMVMPTPIQFKKPMSISVPIADTRRVQAEAMKPMLLKIIANIPDVFTPTFFIANPENKSPGQTQAIKRLIIYCEFPSTQSG